MEQFRQVGEVLGSMKALMVLREDIPINKRQCCLILEIFTMAFTAIAAEIRQNLRLEEKSTKWRSLDQPLREIYRVFKDAELYLRQCLDVKDWWGKVIILHQNKDCVEFHIHNLLCSFPAIIEGIEAAAEISGVDPDEIRRRGVMLRRKYDNAWNDPKLFRLRYGEKYLVSTEMCRNFESAYREDQWLLAEALKEKRKAESGSWTKNEHRLCDSMLKKLNNGDPNEWVLFPGSILTGAKDFQVRRRLGGNSQFKEIQWLGTSFVMRHVIGEIDPVRAEISSLLSLSHPNILQYLCGFYDEEKKECFLVMELMNKDLNSFVRESSSPRRRTVMTISVIVDVMLQIARGMEYLHSHNIYHGELNPSNILLKPRPSSEGYLHVKVAGFGLSTAKNQSSPRQSSSDPDTIFPFIWYAPEVLLEWELQGNVKNSEKADVYSFGMICFEILTGKVPFEDGHLQGDKMGRNIRAGERPLFPFSSPKFLVNLTKKCWQTDPMSRPSFASICRILRYIKKYLVMNPEATSDFPTEPQMPQVADFCEIESGFQKKFGSNSLLVSQIPFEMFSFRLAEMEKNCHGYVSEEVSKSAIDGALTYKDEEFLLGAEDLIPPPASILKSVYSDVMERKFQAMRKTVGDARSVYSDVPRKLILSPRKGASDTRSVYSDAPEKKSSSNKRGLRGARAIFSTVPEKKTLLVKKGGRETNPFGFDSPEKKSMVVKKNGKDSSKKCLDVHKLGADLMRIEIPEKKPWSLQKSSSTRSTGKAVVYTPTTPKGKEQRSPSTPRLRSMRITQTKSGLVPAMGGVERSPREETTSPLPRVAT